MIMVMVIMVMWPCGDNVDSDDGSGDNIDNNNNDGGDLGNGDDEGDNNDDAVPIFFILSS